MQILLHSWCLNLIRHVHWITCLNEQNQSVGFCLSYLQEVLKFEKYIYGIYIAHWLLIKATVHSFLYFATSSNLHFLQKRHTCSPNYYQIRCLEANVGPDFKMWNKALHNVQNLSLQLHGSSAAPRLMWILFLLCITWFLQKLNLNENSETHNQFHIEQTLS